LFFSQLKNKNRTKKDFSMSTTPLILPGSSHSFIVPPEKAGSRLDAFLVEQFPGYSRSFFSRVIEDKLVTIGNTRAHKAGISLKAGEVIHITFPVSEKNSAHNSILLQDTGLKIIYQEPSFAIIYKPAGITVHPASDKTTEPTLVDWLLTTFAHVETIGYKDRPGIVHRLDKDTSGLMVIPLTAPAFSTFSALFKDRKIHKTYLAIVKGHPEKEGIINYSIARHPTVRNKMAHHTEGRAATTHFTTLSYFTDYSLVEARPVTGRTHQIRVHFATLGHPLLGDKVYGSNSPLIARHALHASNLQFMFKGKKYEFHAPLPEDMETALQTFQKEN
jgi:23S rRNA pseudouridine1911/1915/1917 synthase